MRFGSWIYKSDELILDYFEGMKYVDLNEYVPSGTWVRKIFLNFKTLCEKWLNIDESILCTHH